MDQAHVPLQDIKFLTAKETAARLRVSTMTVYRLCHRGGLDAIQVQREWRIPERAVDEYLRTAFVGAR